MKLGAMQPYFVPYIGYWQLIQFVDTWIVFDEADFHKRSWMNRNRILHPDQNKDFQYISIPVESHSRGTKISAIQIQNDQAWRETIRGQLTLYKRMRAPFYEHIKVLMDNILNFSDNGFTNFCIHSMQQICSYLKIPFNYLLSSDLSYDRKAVTCAGDWALQMAVACKADSYINPVGGYAIFNESDFLANGLQLQFLESLLPAYKQGRREKFIPALSIIDVLMFNDVDTIKNQLETGYKIHSMTDLISGTQHA